MIPFSRAITRQSSASPYSWKAKLQRCSPWWTVRYLVRSGDSKGRLRLAVDRSVTDLRVSSTLARTGMPLGRNMVKVCLMSVTTPWKLREPQAKVTVGGRWRLPSMATRAATRRVRWDTSVGWWAFCWVSSIFFPVSRTPLAGVS